jgi:hypothetical protein
MSRLKSPDERARRNKASTRATLPASGSGKEAPALPTRYVGCVEFGCGPHCRKGKHALTWHPLTVAFWKVTWASPMATQYEDADVPGLYRLAVLIDQFWTNPAPTLGAEIRLEQQPYGLTPLDRKRLEWQIEQTTAAQKRHKAPVKLPKPGDDPRILHMGTRK